MHVAGAALWLLLVVSYNRGSGHTEKDQLWTFLIVSAAAIPRVPVAGLTSSSANFPYYVVTADGRTLLCPDNGRGFMRLDLAKKFVELMTA
jgi:hypothetical protein